MHSLFCSKTIAVCYKNAGLLKADLDCNDIFPKHFSQKSDDFMEYQACTPLSSLPADDRR